MHPRSSRLLLSLIAALALAAGGCNCKNPPPEPATQASAPAPTAQPVASPRDDRPVIVAFGDSLTAGYGTDAGNSYPDFLERDLNDKGFHYHVVNAGISGNTTKDGIERLQDVLALKPSVVIVAFGGNDGLRGLPIDTTRRNLDQIVSTLQRAGTKIVLGGITLPPNYGADYIRQFNLIYASLSKQYHVPLLPFLLKDVYGTPGSMQADGIHATAQGNQQVARNLLPLVLPLLHKQ
jgi:acyl-CoA thioesterase I